MSQLRLYHWVFLGWGCFTGTKGLKEAVAAGLRGGSERGGLVQMLAARCSAARWPHAPRGLAARVWHVCRER